MGININLVLDVGVSVLNPMNLVKMGIEPMSVLIVRNNNLIQFLKISIEIRGQQMV